MWTEKCGGANFQQNWQAKQYEKKNEKKSKQANKAKKINTNLNTLDLLNIFCLQAVISAFSTFLL